MWAERLVDMVARQGNFPHAFQVYGVRSMVEDSIVDRNSLPARNEVGRGLISTTKEACLHMSVKA